MQEIDGRCPRCGRKSLHLSTHKYVREGGLMHGRIELDIAYSVRCNSCYLSGPMAIDEQSAVFWWRHLSTLIRERGSNEDRDVAD